MLDQNNTGFGRTCTICVLIPGVVSIMNADDIELVETCPACPEQYNAYVDGEQVGYLRLRHGYFRVDVPDCGGETIYEAEPQGDGVFEPDERDGYLAAAKSAILAWLQRKPTLNSQPPVMIEEPSEGSL